jgi:hypothetical protein
MSCENCIVNRDWIYRTAFTIYGEQFFKNLEEVKKVIHANVDTGQPVRADA